MSDTAETIKTQMTEATKTLDAVLKLYYVVWHDGVWVMRRFFKDPVPEDLKREKSQEAQAQE